MLGLTQFDLSKEELEQLQNRKWKLSSSTTKIHPSHSEPVLQSISELREAGGGRGRGREEGGGRGRGREGEETTVRDAFQRLSLIIVNKQSQWGPSKLYRWCWWCLMFLCMC